MTSVKQDREFTEDVIGNNLLPEAIDWIQRNLNPDDVFLPSQLEAWAESNGYVKEA